MAEVMMPDIESVHPGMTLGTQLNRAKAKAATDARITAGAAYVTEWLRRQYGDAGDAEPGDCGLVWRVSPLTTHEFCICLSELALAQSYFQLGGWLGLIAEDARASAPVPPACYQVGEHGLLGVRGMNVVEFEAFGQGVRCERRTGPAGDVWSLWADGMPRGVPFPASPDDLRDDVAQRALLLLREAKLIRIPDAPWQWSVIGGLGREWWVRLTSGDPSLMAVRELVLRDTVSGQEERMPWPDDVAPPRAGQLRRLVGG